MHPIREAAHSVIRTGFLRVDRGGALYVSDLPSRAEPGSVIAALERLELPARVEGGLMRIEPGRAWIGPMRAWAAARAREDEQCRLLTRLSTREISDEEVRLWIEGIKLVERFGDPAAYERSLRSIAAICMRTGHGGGLLAHCRALYVIAKREENG